MRKGCKYSRERGVTPDPSLPSPVYSRTVVCVVCGSSSVRGPVSIRRGADRRRQCRSADTSWPVAIHSRPRPRHDEYAVKRLVSTHAVSLTPFIVQPAISWSVLRATTSPDTRWPCGTVTTVPGLQSWGRGFDSRPWFLCTNANSACHPSGVG